jgi:hypothetical protein
MPLLVAAYIQYQPFLLYWINDYIALFLSKIVIAKFIIASIRVLLTEMQILIIRRKGRVKIIYALK